MNGDKISDVIISTPGGYVYAIDGASDGEAYLWNYGVTPSRKTAPALCDLNNDAIDDVIVGDRTGNITVLDGSNGHQLNQINVLGSIAGTPVIGDLTSNGRADIVVGTENNKIVILETESPIKVNQIVWNSN